MKHIDTTLTKIKKIKSLAKKIKKEKSIQLCKAQDEASREFGYDDFRHAHHCFKNTDTSRFFIQG